MTKLRHPFIHVLLLLSILLFFESCSFDSMFLFPDRIDAGHPSKIYVHMPERTVVDVRFEGTALQPVLSKDGKPFDPGYGIESVFFKNKTGDSLYGWFLKPHAGTETRATILFMHGNAANILSHFSIVHPFVAQGFQVFLFDYSGFGFSGGRAGRAQVRADGEAALLYVKERSDVRGKPLVIYGQSLGGNLAPVVAATHADMVDALVVEGAFSSHDGIAAHATGYGFLAHLAVREMYASKDYIKRWHKPVLVIHSTEDAKVPYFMGEELYTNANAHKTLYTIAGAHKTGPIYYTDSICTKINAMLSP